MNRTVTILDTTLRDGSYAVDFQFTPLDTAVIAKALEDVGVGIVEIGHGVGLGASRRGFGEAAATDEEYFAAVAGVLTRARYGMFCIPGVARLEDVDMAADMGATFIRVGTNVTEVPASRPYIERAKARGLFVSANFMKSYALPPARFAETAKLTQAYGSDLLCVVDSAGSMLAGEVRDYFQAVREVCDIALGFHGHNNLGLAVAHSLLAVELGAAMVDSSLQGLGRSSGNAATELLVASLDRMGVATGVDLLGVMDAGEKLIRPLVQSRGLSSLDMVMGYAQFHSSYMGVIRKYASRERVDPRRLIIELCKHDKVNAPDALVARVAAGIEEKADQALTSRFIFTRYHGNEQERLPDVKNPSRQS
jgi:4-hydroxy-2-oxovalerate aldolase